MLELIDTLEKEKLFSDYMSHKLKTQSYLNILFQLDNKNDKILRKFQNDIDPRKHKKNSFFVNLILHNGVNIKSFKKHYGKPIKTLELGEYGTELDALYMFIVRIHGKLVLLAVDDRGTSIEMESNVTNHEFVEIYKVLIETMIKANKDIYQYYSNLK